MRRILRAACVMIFAFSALADGAFAQSEIDPCRTGGPCQVDGGEYRWLAPSDWNGRDALPAIVFFHGYRSNAAEMLDLEVLRRLAQERRFLLVAPEGLRQTWSYSGSPGAWRDEYRYIGALLDDLERRFQVPRGQALASGFSQGASMVWYAACEMTAPFAAIAPIAGAFWLPEPSICPGGPVPTRHSHGTADRTVPLAGRPIGTRFHQGDVLRAIALRRETNGCAPNRAVERVQEGLSCRVDSSCSSGSEVQFCLHDGAHDLREDDVTMAVDWLLRQGTGARSLAGRPKP